MNVQYHGKYNVLRYACTRNHSSYADPLCQGICGRVLDELIERVALKVLEPASVELSLAAVADLQQEQQRLDRHWRQRLERAHHQSDRAARQYHATEPENRSNGNKRFSINVAWKRRTPASCISNPWN